MIWLGLLGCGDPAGTRPAEVPPVVAPVGDEGLSPVERLARASLDLRGVRPTPDEIARVEADPEALDALVETFFVDPRFEERVMALYQEVFLTKMEEVGFFDYAAFDRLLPDPAAFYASVGDEPLRLMAHLATNDLPYDLAVTGDFTVVNAPLGEIWPTDRPAGEPGWKVAHYTDGRPAAGVLATNGLWWRYPSTDSNLQRKRANTVSKLFTCRDFLKTVVPFDNDVDLLDEEALANAIRTNAGCRTCHDTLDPMASYFWGFDFDYEDGFLLLDGVRYHPERERAWVDETGVAPGWYGQTAGSLADLGGQLLRDENFDPCAVEHVYQHLLRRTLLPEDEAVIASAVVPFRQNGRTIRSIWRAVMADPRYRGVVADGVTGVPEKLMTPDLLRSAVADLTGFDWTIDGYTLLDHETYGVATLAGGIDGLTVTSPATVPNTTVVLVQDQLATGAATVAVETERAQDPADRRLFRGVDFRSQAGDAEAVAELVLAVTSRRVDPAGEEVRSLLDLWSEVHALDGRTTTAWAAVLTALLRDPEFVLY